MLECLSLATLSSLAYSLQSRPGAYPRVEHLKVSSIGWAPFYQQTSDWKGLPRTNSIASFYTIEPLFHPQWYGKRSSLFFGGKKFCKTDTKNDEFFPQKKDERGVLIFEWALDLIRIFNSHENSSRPTALKFVNVRNKLERFSLSSISSLV